MQVVDVGNRVLQKVNGCKKMTPCAHGGWSVLLFLQKGVDGGVLEFRQGPEISMLAWMGM